MKLRVLDLLVLVLSVGFYLILRARSVTFSSEAHLQWAPFAISAMLSAYVSLSGRSYIVMYVASFLAALAASTAWGIERVYHLSGTAFMQDDWSFNQYGDDPAIVSIEVFVKSLFAMITCGSLGPAFTLFFRKTTQEQS
ncbi:hypothetical protein SH467x_004247 [Pirellulaceae bacterium SH467]